MWQVKDPGSAGLGGLLGGLGGLPGWGGVSGWASRPGLVSLGAPDGWLDGCPDAHPQAPRCAGAAWRGPGGGVGRGGVSWRVGARPPPQADSQEGLHGAVGAQRVGQQADAAGAGHDAQVEVELRQRRGARQGPADAAEVAVAEAAAAQGEQPHGVVPQAAADVAHLGARQRLARDLDGAGQHGARGRAGAGAGAGSARAGEPHTLRSPLSASPARGSARLGSGLRAGAGGRRVPMATTASRAARPGPPSNAPPRHARTQTRGESRGTVTPGLPSLPSWGGEPTHASGVHAYNPVRPLAACAGMGWETPKSKSITRAVSFPGSIQDTAGARQS